MAGVQAADGATKAKLRKKPLGRARKTPDGFGKKLSKKAKALDETAARSSGRSPTRSAPT